jgi:hypothetical protein
MRLSCASRTPLADARRKDQRPQYNSLLGSQEQRRNDANVAFLNDKETHNVYQLVGPFHNIRFAKSAVEREADVNLAP